MTEQHPIRPPDALRAQWREEAPAYRDFGVGRENWFMNRGAQWGADQQLKLDAEQINQAWQKGADQELEACCEWTTVWISAPEASQLRAARRPKRPSEAEQALAALEADPKDGAMIMIDAEQFSIIHRALERLKELEGLANA
jgi:hypothetical protein